MKNTVTISNDRKTGIRAMADALDISYTSALRIHDKAPRLLEEKTLGFLNQQVWPGDLLTWGELDPVYPKSVHKHPWCWHPGIGFSRNGIQQQPKTLTGHAWMNTAGLRPRTAFELGAGMGLGTGNQQYTRTDLPYRHPACQLASELYGPQIDLTTAAGLGFAARGTGWVLSSRAAKALIVRRMAQLVSATLRDTAATASPQDAGALLFIAQTAEARLAGPFDDEMELRAKAIHQGYEDRINLGLRDTFTMASYSVSALLMDMDKDAETSSPDYYASAKRMGHLFGVIGDLRTNEFIKKMAELFSALYVQGRTD